MSDAAKGDQLLNSGALDDMLCDNLKSIREILTPAQVKMLGKV